MDTFEKVMNLIEELDEQCYLIDINRSKITTDSITCYLTRGRNSVAISAYFVEE